MKDQNVLYIGGVSATNSRLLRAALDRDDTAWSDLVRTYGASVYRMIRQAGLQEMDAAEVANQVFILVAQSLPEFQQGAKKGSFRGWLRSITQNAVADWRRVQGRQICQAAGGTNNRSLLRSQAAPSDESKSGPMALTVEQVAIERVRERTDPAIWRVFWLVTTEQMTPTEAATECNLSRNAVYIIKHRLSKEIRGELSGGFHYDQSSRESGGSHGDNRSMP